VTQRLRTRRTRTGAVIAGLLSFLMATPYAYPEAYIGGQIGTTLAGNTLTGVELTDFSPPGTMSDRELAQSALLGVKAGYYFPRARWFGIEAEFFQTTPHIKQQNTQITIPTAPPSKISARSREELWKARFPETTFEFSHLFRSISCFATIRPDCNPISGSGWASLWPKSRQRQRASKAPRAQRASGSTQKQASNITLPGISVRSASGNIAEPVSTLREIAPADSDSRRIIIHTSSRSVSTTTSSSCRTVMKRQRGTYLRHTHPIIFPASAHTLLHGFTQSSVSP